MEILTRYHQDCLQNGMKAVGNLDLGNVQIGMHYS